MTVNRQWLLAEHPERQIGATHFARHDAVAPSHDLSAGQVLVRNRMFAIAPTIRNRLNPTANSQRGSVSVGGVVPGMAGGEVVVSRHPAWAVGDRLIAMARWEDWSVIKPDQAVVPPFRIPPDMTFGNALGPLSLNSLTAYFGMTDVGQVLRTDTVLISGAAGSVGSVACQVAKIAGARVVALAGGTDKCAWLLQNCGVDAAIDYRVDDFALRLAEAAPDGFTLFFDNVGGSVLDAAIDNMASHGRIVLCGQIAAYDGIAPASGPRDMMKVVYGRLKMQGFVVGDYVDQADKARATLTQWLADGLLQVRVDRRFGFDAIPQAFVDLFAGRNRGTLVVEND